MGGKTLGERGAHRKQGAELVDAARGRPDALADDRQELASLYRSLAEHSPTGFALHQHGTIVLANQSMALMLGADRIPQIVGEPISRFLAHPQDLDIAKTVALSRLDGAQLEVEAMVMATTWRNAPAYALVVRDLTPQRRAEADAARAEQHFTAVVSQLEEGVLVADHHGRIESINPAAERIFGVTATDAIGVAIDTLPPRLLDADAQPLPPERYPLFRTLATGASVTGFVFGLDRPDGQRRWLSTSNRLLNPDDPASSVLCSFTDITELRVSRRHLEYQATHDPLTGLANRSLLLARLAQVLEDGQQAVSAVLFIDLNGFKAINDDLGHAVGDTVLQIVGQRLLAGLEADDTTGRLGGDEFLVLLSGDRPPEQLDDRIERLRRMLAEPILARGYTVHVEATVGCTQLRPGDTRTAEMVLQDADLAMYRAKPRGLGSTPTTRASWAVQ